MSDGRAKVHTASDGGVSGKHDAVAPSQFNVAPSTSDELNTVHLRLTPVACWRVDDIRFAFDSSFVDADPSDPKNPNDIRVELAHLITLLKDYPDCPLSVFGHADPVGTDDYNKQLSGRRAMAIYSLIVAHGDTAKAVSLWQQISSTENWGDNQHQKMQSFTGLPAGTPNSDLIKAYLQKLCPNELVLNKTDFLAQGADSAGKGDYQGCSEFNPLLIFSQEKQAQFDQAKQQNDAAGIAERNEENAINRRVMVLLFRVGSKVDPQKWPCPSALGDKSGCIKRFWSDGETRRSTHLPGVDRKFTDTYDTFACRFYQRISISSPCESIPLHPFRYGIEFGTHMPWTDDAVMRIVSEDGSQERVFTKSDGVVSGIHRVFTFADYRKHVRYFAEIRDKRHVVGLFGLVELYRIVDPNDPLHILPPPAVQPVDPGPVPPDPEPSELQGHSEGVDPENVEAAADPPHIPAISTDA